MFPYAPSEKYKKVTMRVRVGSPLRGDRVEEARDGLDLGFICRLELRFGNLQQIGLHQHGKEEKGTKENKPRK